MNATLNPVSGRALACIAGLGIALAMAAPARADVAMISTPRDTPISAYKGTLAWSEWDTVKQQYRLVLTTVKTGKATKPKIGLRTSPFDVSLGPDSDGKTVALYSRCSKSDGTKCDAYRYDLAKKKESKLDFSRSDRDEAWPSQWQGRYAWVEQRGKGDDPNDYKDGNCDAPMTRAVSSSSAVKELSKGTCGTVTGQSLRKSTIVQTVMWADDITRNFSELRQLSVKGGGAKRLARLQGLQGGDIYSAPLLDDEFFYAVRTGSGTTSRFVRIERSTGKMQLIEALTPLAARLARDGNTSFYLEQQVGDQGAPGIACATYRPCRLVRADPSVFGSGERKLAPRLTLQLPPAITADQPLSLSGSLMTPVVRQGVLVRSEPVAGATLEGLQATDLNSANGESLRATGRTVTTGADGTWALTIQPPLPADGYYAAITRSLPVAAQSPFQEFKTSGP